MPWAEELDTYLDKRTVEEKALQELFYKVVLDREQENLLKMFLKGTRQAPIVIPKVMRALGRSEEHISKLYNDLVRLNIMAKTLGFKLTETGHAVVELIRRRNVLLKWLGADESREKFLRLYDDIDEFEVCNSMCELVIRLPMPLESLAKLILELCRQGVLFFAPEGTPEPGFVLTTMGKALWHALKQD